MFVFCNRSCSLAISGVLLVGCLLSGVHGIINNIEEIPLLPKAPSLKTSGGITITMEGAGDFRISVGDNRVLAGINNDCQRKCTDGSNACEKIKDMCYLQSFVDWKQAIDSLPTIPEIDLLKPLHDASVYTEMNLQPLSEQFCKNHPNSVHRKNNGKTCATNFGNCIKKAINGVKGK